MFLSTGLSIRHCLVNLYDENFCSMQRKYEGQAEKVTIQDLTLAIYNQKVYNLKLNYR